MSGCGQNEVSNPHLMVAVLTGANGWAMLMVVIGQSRRDKQPIKRRLAPSYWFILGHDSKRTVDSNCGLWTLNQLYLRLRRGHGVGEPAHAVLRPGLCFSRGGRSLRVVPSLPVQPATAACCWRAGISKR